MGVVERVLSGEGKIKDMFPTFSMSISVGLPKKFKNKLAAFSYYLNPC